MRQRSLKNPVFVHVSELVALKKTAETVLSPMQKKQAFKDIGDVNSPFKSKGLDFQEVRQYQPGDDPRQIDWRVTAKYGEPFTKLYTDEKARSVFIVADLRTHMKFASHGDFKSVVCAKSCALLTFAALHHQDKTTIQLLLPTKIQLFSNLKKSDEVGGLLNTLSDATYPYHFPHDNVSFTQNLQLASKQAAKGSIIFILSDFHDLTDDVEPFFAALTHKNTVTCIHIYDFLERQLPAGYLPVTDGEDLLIADMTTKRAREAFSEKFDRRHDLIEQWCTRYEMNFLTLRNDTDYIRNLRFFYEKESSR